MLSGALAVVWTASVALAGGYDPRFIGVGSGEFRRVLNAAVCLTASLAVISYAFKFDLARSYVVLALPSATAFDLTARYFLRKRLHRRRRRGQFMRRTVVRRRPGGWGLDGAASAVARFGADTVAVLACPEMNGRRLRELAWNLEKTRTDMYVASALLDVAGPRTTIRPVAGLPLLHVDHPELAGMKQVIKSVFDKVSAALAVIVLSPLFGLIALAIWIPDRESVFFRQTRVCRDGRLFRVWKFRTMVADAEARKAQLLTYNEANGALFKMRRDPRVTRAGAWLRRWSLDELPQLLSVLVGDMSMVGPRRRYRRKPRSTDITCGAGS